MNISERIKVVRKALNMNQEELALALNLKRNSICLLETGRRNPSERTILDFSDKLNVSVDWLKDEKGEMFNPIENKFSEYVSRIDDSDDNFIKTFIEVYMELDENSKVVLRDIAKKMVEKYK